MRKMKVSKEFWADARWVEEHYSELADKYPDQWVAVVDRKVVAAGKDGGKVKEEAWIKTKREYISVTYIECGHHVF